MTGRITRRRARGGAVAVAALVTTMASGCGGAGASRSRGGGGGGAAPARADITLVAAAPSGEAFGAFGPRAASGSLARLSGATFSDGAGASLTVLVGNDGFPARASSHGLVFLFDSWTASTTDIFLLTEQDGLVAQELAAAVDAQAVAALAQLNAQGIVGIGGATSTAALAPARYFKAAGLVLGLSSCAAAAMTAPPKYGVGLSAATAPCGSALVSAAALLTGTETVPEVETALGATACVVGLSAGGCGGAVLDALAVRSAAESETIRTLPDAWRSMPNLNDGTGAPTARSVQVAAAIGGKMIVWGGTEDGASALVDGGVYDPTADIWEDRPNLRNGVGAPSARREGHTAVAVTSTMIVWGGADTLGLSNTGGVYDPATDTWETTPNLSAGVGAPSPRLEHSAISTGSRMIVWGGYTTGGLTDTGGMYDPATDTWVSAPNLESGTGAPEARLDHTAIWTGSVMIVWGGTSGSALPTDPDLDTGGIYDPATDAWTPITTVGAPDARTRHTAVWTGSHMIVWGGEVGATTGNALDTGGAYDPATDTWTALSTAGAPSRRVAHTAVWTGAEMLVWGGNVRPGVLHTGGAYDFATDTWAPISSVDCPAGRTQHTAVFVAGTMILWGGTQPGQVKLDEGGAYVP